jgi:hypothetical protein
MIYSLNSNLSNIGTIIYGAKYTFAIAPGGANGYIGYIDLTKGTWLVFVGGWAPCGRGYVEIASCDIAQGWDRAFQFEASGIVKLTADATLKARLVNWGDDDATKWANGYIKAIRIA